MQEDKDLKNILNSLEIDDIEKVKTDIKNEILINRPKRTYKPKNQKVNNKMRGRPPTKDVILNINDIKNSNEKTDDIKQSVNEVASVLEKNNDIPPPPPPPVRSPSTGYNLPEVKQEPRPLTREERIRQIMGF